MDWIVCAFFVRSIRTETSTSPSPMNVFYSFSSPLEILYVLWIATQERSKVGGFVLPSMELKQVCLGFIDKLIGFGKNTLGYDELQTPTIEETRGLQASSAE